MSRPVRIALVAEGPTDRIVIESAMRSILGERPFLLRQLQPEPRVLCELGAGWAGVYRWCKQSARRGSGRLSGDPTRFIAYDLWILHLDADVADEQYRNGKIDPEPTDLTIPCAQSCPPAGATTNELRKVLLSWCGEPTVPEGTVICMPSKSMETWVIAAVLPNDMMMRNHPECYKNPAGRLTQQPKDRRFYKNQEDYETRADAFRDAWPMVAELGEAARFQGEFLRVLPP